MEAKRLDDRVAKLTGSCASVGCVQLTSRGDCCLNSTSYIGGQHVAFPSSPPGRAEATANAANNTRTTIRNLVFMFSSELDRTIR